ncbi:DUF805 domain-containing protein [Microbulbifer sp. SAOS-129_SWC]|uniref:DUF805 domain-containing protein n=1 Tax=Microbulbifer sp. SAOS-129_SWC TaxID=3145235 RepID=UPI003217848B
MSTAANPYASPQTADLATDAGDRPAEPQIFSFTGRLGRMRFFSYLMISSFLTLVLASVLVMVLVPASPVLAGLAYLAIIGVSLVYGLSIYVRRLHDLNQPGVWLLLMFVPLANFGLLIYLFFFRGTDGSNNYGPRTTPNSSAVIVTFVLGIFLNIASIGIVVAVAIPAYQDYMQRVQTQ